MSSSQELANVLREAEAALAASERGELVLPVRKRIWAAMGPRELIGPRATIAPPLRRRTRLAALTARRVLPIWQEAFPGNRGPERILAVAGDYLQGQLSYIAASDAKNLFWAELERLGENPVMAGYAAANVLSTALNDEPFDVRDLDSKLDYDLDVYEWDTGFCASIAAADGAPWEPTSNRDARRRFWEWYIREAAPAAWAAEEKRSTGAADT